LSTVRRKHIPFRTCIACRQKRPKRELLRVVRTPEGSITIDPQGKLSGRGAYLCPSRECWEVALDPGKLGRALKCQISAEELANLRLAALPLLVDESTDLAGDSPVASQDVD